MVLKLSKKVEEVLRKKHYGVYNHSAVQICSWTKKALKGEGYCYKKKFYNIDTHRCVEFSPVSMWCSQNCIFCWRPMEYMKLEDLNSEKLDEPEELMKGILKEREKLLSGFGGNEKVSKELLEEAFNPTHFAISLSGEPTLYPKLLELIAYLKSLPNTKSIFLVSNAQEENMFERFLKELDKLPTQFYVSLDAPNEEVFKRVNVPIYQDGWARLLRNLKRFSKFNTRKVIRFTLIKGLNDSLEYLKSYKKLIELSKTDFIEVKAYMHLGMSQKRLKKENMPTHEEVGIFAREFEKVLGNYTLVDEMPESRIYLLRRNDSPYQPNISPFENEKRK